MKTTVNPRCDGSHCTEENGQVREMPLGGGARAFLCVDCWGYEHRYQYERAKERDENASYPQLNWFEAKIVPDDFVD